MVSLEIILLISIAVIVGLSILWGIIQGFKKGLYNLAATILFWVLFFLTANLVVRLICSDLLLSNTGIYATINASAGLEQNLQGSYEINTLMDYFKYFLGEKMNLDPELLADPAIENTLIALIMSILKIVYLIILAIFYTIVRIVIYRTVFHKYCKPSKKRLNNLKKKQEDYYAKNEKENPKLAKEIEREQKKFDHRGLNKLGGILTGFARGALASFLILSVVNATVKLIPNLNDSTETASTEDSASRQSLYDFILKYVGDNEVTRTAIDMIKEYQGSKLINSTGLIINGKPADDIFIDAIVSGKSQDYSVSLRKEMSLIVQVAEYAFDLTNGFDMEHMNYTSLNPRQVNDLKQILVILSDSDLIQNLGSVLVGIAVSVDAIKDKLGEDFKLYADEYAEIDWKQELLTISTLVADVYSLGDDISKLDYFDLDEELVADIVETLGSLKLINVLGHIGVSFGINAIEYKNGTYDDELGRIKESLVQLAIDGKFGTDIASFKDLYSEFINIYREAGIDPKELDSKSLYNLTYIDSLELSPIFNTIFEANFVSTLLPDVLSIVREEALPAEYGSIINPNVSTSSQWESEINAVLQIVHDITHNTNGEIQPFDDIKKYDFELLRNFSSETVVNSELLSYAMISIMIEGSKKEGLLSKVDGIENYLQVPDPLAADPDANHKFNEKWYGTKDNPGELMIMLDTIKDVASQLENLEYPIGSLPAMLSAINQSKLMDSDVLYYSLDNVIQTNLNTYLTIPLDDTTQSQYTVNGQYKARMIKRSSIKEVVDVLSDSNVVDIQSIFAYYTIDEDGKILNEVASKEAAPAGVEVVTVLDTSTSKIMGLLTSKKLYDPAHPEDETNINKLFNSNILRASVTTLLNEYAGDKIVVPDNSVEESVQCLTGKKDEETGKTIQIEKQVDIIKRSQFKALIMAVDDLDLPLGDLVSGKDLDVNKFVDALKKENSSDLKDNVKDIFGAGENGYNSSKYSGILHGTLSKYLLDEADKEGSDIKIVVPDETKDAADAKLIAPSETVDLIQAIVIVGTDALLDSNGNSDTMINDIVTNVIDNDKALNSKIIRATLTNYVEGENTGVVIPSEAHDNTIESVNVVSKNDFNDLLQVLKAMKEIKEEQSGKTTSYSDLLDTANLTISMITDTNKKEGHPISKSLIIRATLQDQLEKNDIAVPLAAHTDRDELKTLSMTETDALVDALGAILDSEMAVTNISTNNITVEKITSDDSRTAIKSSIIIKNLVTDKVKEVKDDDNKDMVVIPDESLDADGIIVNDEIDNMLQGFGKLVNDKQSTISNMKLDDIKVSSLTNAKSNISASLILRATVTKLLKEQDSVAVSDSAVDKTLSKEMLTANEMDSVIVALNSLFDDEDSVNNLNIDNLTVGKVSGARNSINASLVFRTTITKQVVDNNDIEVPSAAIDNDVLSVNKDEKEYGTLTVAELNNLLTILDALGSDKKVNAIQADDITVKTLSDRKEEISNSNIMRATLHKNVKDNNDILIPSVAVSNDTSAKDGGNIEVITKAETESLVDVLDAMFAKEDKVNNLDISNLTLGKISSIRATINASYIMRTTISGKIEDNDSVNVPVEAIDNDIAVVTKNAKTYKTLTTGELDKLLQVLNALGSDTKVDDVSADNVTVATLKSQKANIQGSSIMRATLHKNVKDNNDVLVPAEATTNSTLAISGVATSLISASETASLIDVLDALFDDESKVNNLAVNNLTIGNISSSKDKINASYIMRTTISGKIEDNDSVNVPVEAIDNDIAVVTKNAKTYKTLTTGELDKLLQVLNALGSDTKVDDVSADNVTVATLKSQKANIQGSSIMRATLHKNVKDNNDVLVPTEATTNSTLAISGTATSLISASETASLIDVLDALFDDESKVNNLDVNNLTVGDVSSSKDKINASYIMRTTISGKIEDNNSVDVPVTAIDNTVGAVTKNAKTYKTLTTAELSDLLTILNSFGTDNKVNNVSANNVTVKALDEQKATFANSNVMRATLFKNMQSNADLTISSGTYDTAVSAKDSTQNVKVLTAAETGALIDVLVSLFDENEKVTEVSFDGLSIGALNDNSEAICNSLVIHGTVSNKLLTNSSVVVVDDEIEVTDINLINDTELKAFLSDLNKIFGEALINNLATSISGGDTVDKAISEYSDTDKYTSEIFRATTSRFIINTPSFSAFEIERDDLGTETKTVTINNLDRYADNKADIITQDEFDHLFEAMKAIKENTGNQEASITSLFEPGSATKLSFNTLAASSDELVESYILRKEFSKQIKDELNSATLDFLDGLYLGTEATGKLYVSKSEMKNILNAVTVLNVDNISNINLDINSDSSFIYSLNETNIKALCNSTLISFNIRKSLVSANTGGGYFNNILALTQGIAKEDVDSLDVLTGSEYVYSTTNVDNDHPSEVCSLLVSVVSLKNNGYLSIITNPAGATLGTFKDEAFVVTVTDDSILRDSIPGIITNLGSKSTNPTFNLSSLEVPARAYSAPGRIKKDYMKGVNLYTDGELYRFIDAIEASNQLMSEATRERVLTMLRSDIAFDTIDAALVTIDSTFGFILPKRISTVENADITIGDGTTVNRRDYDSTNGHAFIDGILTYL